MELRDVERYVGFLMGGERRALLEYYKFGKVREFERACCAIVHASPKEHFAAYLDAGGEACRGVFFVHVCDFIEGRNAAAAAHVDEIFAAPKRDVGLLEKEERLTRNSRERGRVWWNVSEFGVACVDVFFQNERALAEN